ncbi:MAG: polysaccharide deacetylase family protein [Spirochaetes bacterium]|nr:polysaccharide deacetylase family protein [Spirochaetota bacterium]
MIDRISTIRWHVKKSSRKIIAYGTSPFMRLCRSIPGVKPSVRVLTYHRFGDRAYDPFCVSIPVFSMQMKWLAETGRAVTLEQVEAHASGNAAVPDGSVLVTIDDGFRSVYTDALPVLQKYRIPAVVFVASGAIGKTEQGSEYSDQYLLPEDIRKISRDGIAIGSHSVSHGSMARLSPPDMEREARDSRRILEKLAGKPVTSFAYPYGTRADYNDDTARILRNCGYTSVYTSQHGPVHAGMDPWELPRVKVEGGESLSMFKCICDGGMDAWRLVDRLLSGFQNVNRK